MSTDTPQLPPPGGDPSSGWTILGQSPHQHGPGPRGTQVTGVILTIRTGLGQIENVFIPDTMYQQLLAVQQAPGGRGRGAQDTTAYRQVMAYIDQQVKANDLVMTLGDPTLGRSYG